MNAFPSDLGARPGRPAPAWPAGRLVGAYLAGGPSSRRSVLPRLARQGGRSFVALAVLAMLSFPTAPRALAQGSADYSVEISQKFGRGLLNVLSSPFEIPCAIRDDVAGTGAGGAVTGLFKGVAFFARRLLVGVCEVGTFVIPMEATLPPVCAEKPAANVQPKP